MCGLLSGIAVAAGGERCDNFTADDRCSHQGRVSGLVPSPGEECPHYGRDAGAFTSCHEMSAHARDGERVCVHVLRKGRRGLGADTMIVPGIDDEHARAHPGGCARKIATEFCGDVLSSCGAKLRGKIIQCPAASELFRTSRDVSGCGRASVLVHRSRRAKKELAHERDLTPDGIIWDSVCLTVVNQTDQRRCARLIAQPPATRRLWVPAQPSASALAPALRRRRRR